MAIPNEKENKALIRIQNKSEELRADIAILKSEYYEEVVSTYTFFTELLNDLVITNEVFDTELDEELE